jgi:hypothetical protein
MPLTKPTAAQINFDATNITDPLILLNSGEAGSADKDTGLVIERGSDTNVGLIWDESADQFAFINTTETGTTSGNVTIASYANVKADEFHGDGSNLTGLTPADGSVTTVKLADDSVTAAKVTLPLGIKIITGITTAYEITAADMADTTHLVVFYAASSSAYIINCPTAANMSGKMITIINTVSSTGNVSLQHNAGGHISGLAQNLDSLPAYASVVSDGTNVYMCGHSQGGGASL